MFQSKLMRKLVWLLLLPVFVTAQSKDGRQVVAVTITQDPDETELDQYYLVANIPAAITLKPGQTFLLQSAWHKEGDSVVNIGAGTVRTLHDTYAELIATLYPGKKAKKGDMAMFLVPLALPGNDTLFFKLARYDISFSTVEDSLFYDRNTMLLNPYAYPAARLLEAMAKDIRFTGKVMATQSDSQAMEITNGKYKGQQLFAMMQKVHAGDVLQFVNYVYARPDKYKAHIWKVSEIFATWVINGAPVVKK